MSELSGNRLIWPLLLLIVLAAGVIRHVGLGDTPLWTDEALTLIITEIDPYLLWTVPIDPTPPMYYSLIELLFSGQVPDAWLLRLPSFIMGTVAVGLMFLAGRAAGGARVGLLSAVLLTVQTYHVVYSQEARAYGMLFVFILLSALALTTYLRGWRNDDGTLAADPLSPLRRRFLTYYVVAAILAIYTHYTAVFWLSISLAATLAYEMKLASAAQRKLLLRRYLALSALLALCMIPAVMFITHFTSYWSMLSHISLAELMTLQRRVYFLSEWDNAILDLILLGMVLAGLFLAWRRTSPAAPVITALLLMPPAMWVAGFVQPVLMERTVLASTIGVVLCLATAIDALPRLLPRVLAVIAVVALFAGNVTMMQIADLKGQKSEDWVGAVNHLRENMQPGDGILMCLPWQYPSLRHTMGDEGTVPAAYFSVDLGKLYRLDRPEHEGQRWTATFLRYWLNERDYFAENRDTLRGYPILWGIRVRCEDKSLEDYQATIDAIPGVRVQSWSSAFLSVDRIQLAPTPKNGD